MKRVRAKKHLGQHFLNEPAIAERITESLSTPPTYVIEVGPGMGVLTQFLVNRPDIELQLVEIDTESVSYLHEHYPQLQNKIIEGDFLKLDFQKLFPGKFSIIGNFPYNISSQIFFKAFENRHQVEALVGMVQKEVGRRITSGPGSKEYGILSVFLQSFYTAEYLFTVDEHVFIPPPKVKSGVIRLLRNDVEKLPCDEKLFIKVVKAAFNQRRKTMRNSLKNIPCNMEAIKHLPVFNLRPEQLSVQGFQELTSLIQEHPLCE
ncbi:16S rRNA (adenine(1518)-N(6)/adenine(1519)-N(6))-dimethyltransferase RsmA [Natronoflexus pectinivorans]|uniref:Ribosomal RNA small subunit methyltransferase A n=1 Tax=Natronoflexus pectinivorans TaxID=682526 RepID=A0A4R2GP70_9BACT|nr:16S rRNA (adenine(1518)-N(6)/adenine(1519)-N(6))-dimethyltransferase RsmA [Natronoflexus pectinivorans]TCO10857.1 16S rRNA (adenine1518-N6/adenine1519-N6)-dimethyltransferase [Natronoflexus pectinivorans]